MNGYNLNNVESILNKAHPMQIINKVNKLNVNLFKVKIEYLTARQNKRTRDLYFLIDTYNPQYDLQNDVNEWVNNYNLNKDKHKQISNATILESLCEGYLRIE